MNFKANTSRALLLCGTALMAAYASAGMAEGWDAGAGTNSWNDVANWIGDALPDSTTQAYVHNGSAVIDGGNATAADLSVGYYFPPGALSSSEFVYGAGSVLATNNASVTTGRLRVGYATNAGNNALSKLTITNGATWTIDPASTGALGSLTVGNGGDAAVEISNGGQLTGLSYFIVGASNGSSDYTPTADLLVTGAGSTLSTSSYIYIGQMNSQSTMTVADGANVTIGGATTLSMFGTGNGTLNLSTGGTFTTTDVLMTRIGRNSVLNFGAALGETAVAAGNLVTTTGGIATGSNASTLVFNHTATTDTPFVLASDITGSGALTIQHASGATLYTGISSASNMTTNITGGSLWVENALAGAVFVTDTGTLGGTGTLTGNTSIYSGATLTAGAPDAIGTLTIDGDLLIATGGKLAVDVAADGVSDLVNVSGTATISGGATVVVTAVDGVDYSEGWSYTVLNAGAIAGQFANAAQVTGDFATFNIAYTATDVTLSIEKLGASGNTSSQLAYNDNQLATLAAVQSLGSTNAIYNAYFLSYADASAKTLDQLDGAIHANTRAAVTEQSTSASTAAATRLQRLQDGAGETGFWSDATTQRLSLQTQVAPADVDATTLAIGFDAQTSGGWTLGLFGQKISGSVAATSASSDIDSTYLGLYGGGTFGAVQMRAGVAHGQTDLSTTRTVAIDTITGGNFSDTPMGFSKADTLLGFAELALRVDATPMGRPVALEPFANLTHVRQDASGFTEIGGAAALDVAGDRPSTTFTTLGLRAATVVALDGANLTLNGSLAWRHAKGDTLLTAQNSFASSDSFTVTGAGIAQDLAAISLGLDIHLGQNTKIGLGYNGLHGDAHSSNGLGARFDMTF